MITKINALTNYTHTEIEAAFHTTLTEMNLQSKDVLQAFRWALSGVGGGPPIFEMAELLGKESVIKRLEKATTIEVIETV